MTIETIELGPWAALPLRRLKQYFRHVAGFCCLAVGALTHLAAYGQPNAPVVRFVNVADASVTLVLVNPQNDAVTNYEMRHGAGDPPSFGDWTEMVESGESGDGVGYLFDRGRGHLVAGLTNGERYAFEVRAIDADGASDPARASVALPSRPGEAVNIPDTRLRDAVQRHLQQQELAGGSTVTQADLASLGRLVASGSNVSGLDGLEHALNLRHLDLQDNQIAGLSPLSGLTELRELHLDDNAIADLSPLSGLAALRRLSLRFNYITDLSPLSGLAALRALHLNDNTAADLSPLSQLTALETLSLNNNTIMDLSPLSGLATLRALHLNNNAIVDLSPLSGLVALRELHLRENDILDLSPLSGLTALRWLALDDNAIADLSPLSGLTALVWLELNANAIVDLSPLSDMTALTLLVLSVNAILDLSPLSGLTALQDLHLHENAILDLSPLSSLTELQKLYLSGNAIVDLSPLSGLPALTVLDLARNAIVDASSLSANTDLDYGDAVDLATNPLSRQSITEHVSALRDRGVAVWFDRPRALLFPAAGGRREGFARIINHGDQAGEVRVFAIDDAGERRGPMRFDLDANAVMHFNSTDLEQGSAAKGVTGGVGTGEGDWRLEFETDLDIEALSYILHEDGFLTSMHDAVPRANTWSVVPILNPGSNRKQVSRLRVVNPDGFPTSPGIPLLPFDDRGIWSALVTVGLPSLPARGSISFSSAELEGLSSSDLLTRTLGDGTGKWRLVIAQLFPPVNALEAISLMESSSGHLTNLSTSPLDGEVPLMLAASDPAGRQGFVRVTNGSLQAGSIRILATDDAGVVHGPVELSIGSYETRHFNSQDLEQGNAAKGLSSGVGAGSGNWRLKLSSERLNIGVLGAYIRHADGFLTATHDLAPSAGGRHRVATFNPDLSQYPESQLRVANLGTETAQVTVSGLDDQGEAGAEAVNFSVPAGAARTLTAAQLEGRDQASGVTGALGDGAGMWRLLVESEQPLQVMSLMETSAGHLTSLSTAPRGPTPAPRIQHPYARPGGAINGVLRLGPNPLD